MRHAYLGPSYTDEAIETALQASGLSYARHDDTARETAERLAAGEVICWFSGGMEFGPRALGARSIVADPRSEAIKDRVNGIKQRQSWRPFGPSVLAGHARDYFEEAFDTRFMLFTQMVLPEKRGEVPAILHVDGSTRPQIVHEETHPEYHRLISHFHALTGVPMVLNTSFNRRGEPIVCTPVDAIASFVGLGADALAIGSFIAERPREPTFALPPTEVTPRFEGRGLILCADNRDDLDALLGAGAWDRAMQTLRHHPDRPVTIPLMGPEMARRASGALRVALRARAQTIDVVLPRPYTQGSATYWEDVPPLSEIRPFLDRIAGPVIARGVTLRTQGIPRCLLPPPLATPGSKSSSSSSRSRRRS